MGACCSSAPKGGSYLDGTASITLDVGRVPSQPNDDTDNDVHSGIAALGPIVDDDAITHQVARMTQRIKMERARLDAWRMECVRNGTLPKKANGKVQSWYENDGLQLQPLLEVTTLLDVRWLLKMATGSASPELGGVLPAWQELPLEAAVTLKQLQAYGGYGLPCAVLSYPWASKTHPDPDGSHLASLVPLLELLVSECDLIGAGCSFGLMWDWASLPQRGHTLGNSSAEGEDRTPQQLARFRVGLAHINEWYAAPYTWTILLDTPLPASATNQVVYGNRGWCVFERRISCLATATRCEISIRDMREAGINPRDDVTGGVFNLSNRIALQKACHRPAPMPPDAFEAYVRAEVDAGRMSFTNGKDLTDVIIPQYRECFMRTLGASAKLVFVNVGWRDADLRQLADSLRFAHAHGCLGRLRELYMAGNQFGDEGLEQIRALLADGVLHKVGYIDLRNSCDVASEGAMQALAATAATQPRRTRSTARAPRPLKIKMVSGGTTARWLGIESEGTPSFT